MNRTVLTDHQIIDHFVGIIFSKLFFSFGYKRFVLFTIFSITFIYPFFFLFAESNLGPLVYDCSDGFISIQFVSLGENNYYSLLLLKCHCKPICLFLLESSLQDYETYYVKRNIYNYKKNCA